MTEERWTVARTCKCGTRMRIRYEMGGLSGDSLAYDCLEGCYVTPRGFTMPGSAVCKGCAKRHPFERGWKKEEEGSEEVAAPVVAAPSVTGIAAWATE